MTVLILDTTGSEATITVAQKTTLLERITLPQGQGLSKTFSPSIQPFISTYQFDYIAVCTGPGSFTGTRVGVTVAQTLAFGLGIPVLGFSSLDLEALYCRYQQKDFQPLELSYKNGNSFLKNNAPLS